MDRRQSLLLHKMKTNYYEVGPIMSISKNPQGRNFLVFLSSNGAHAIFAASQGSAETANTYSPPFATTWFHVEFRQKLADIASIAPARRCLMHPDSVTTNARPLCQTTQVHET